MLNETIWIRSRLSTERHKVRMLRAALEEAAYLLAHRDTMPWEAFAHQQTLIAAVLEATK